MSKSDVNKPPRAGRAVALRYGAGDGAPVIVASGMGYLAEKIVETAADSGVPIYEDNSLATMLSQLKLGQEVPAELYRAIVEIYVYFLNFDVNDPEKAHRMRKAALAPPESGETEELEEAEEA